MTFGNQLKTPFLYVSLSLFMFLLFSSFCMLSILSCPNIRLFPKNEKNIVLHVCLQVQNVLCLWARPQEFGRMREGQLMGSLRLKLEVVTSAKDTSKMPKVVEIRSKKGYTVEIQSLQVIVAVIMIVMIKWLNDMTWNVFINDLLTWSWYHEWMNVFTDPSLFSWLSLWSYCHDWMNAIMLSS